MKKIVLSAIAATAMLTALAVPLVMTPGAALACPTGDFNEDEQVNILDGFLLGQQYGTVKGDDNWERHFDLSGNGEVDRADLEIWAQYFGEICDADVWG